MSTHNYTFRIESEELQTTAYRRRTSVASTFLQSCTEDLTTATHCPQQGTACTEQLQIKIRKQKRSPQQEPQQWRERKPKEKEAYKADHNQQHNSGQNVHLKKHNQHDSQTTCSS